jgi:hypothetical protein
MDQLIIFLYSLIFFFIAHIVFQRIFINKLIRNFIFLFLLHFIIFVIYLIKRNTDIEILLILIFNLCLVQFIYLIIIQAIRSSIQIYILKNHKKISQKNINKENIRLFDYRIKNLVENNIIIKKNDFLIDNSNLIIKLVYNIFNIFKKIYNEKF